MKLLLPLLLLPLLFIVLVNGRRLQVPFAGHQIARDEAIQLQFDALIGTPGQKLRVEIANGDFYENTDLYVPDKKTFGYGFDPEKSSTFVALKNTTTNNGYYLNATDTINLNGSILKTKPIQVVYETQTQSNDVADGRIGLDRYTTDDPSNPCQNEDKCTTFVESVLQDFDEKVLVFAFDKVQSHPATNFTGQLIFGEKPKDLCESVWGVLPEVPLNVTYTQWMFKIDEILVGKYAWKKLMGQASIDLSDPGVNIPQHIYSALLKTIGGSDNYFPCNATANIVFNLGGIDVNVGPELYTQKWKDGSCTFNGNILWEPKYQIPVLALSNYCLLYDYKDFGLKIAKRVEV